MGGKSRTRSEQHVESRQLSPEEKQLIAAQVRYMDKIQPAVDALIDKGTSALGSVYTPNWQEENQRMQGALDEANAGIRGLNTYTNQMDALSQKYAPQLDSIARGELPQQYLNNMQTTYQNLYKQTMGNSLADLASRGVIGGSALNNATNNIQKNLTNQMAQDYSRNLQTAAGLAQGSLTTQQSALGNTMQAKQGLINAQVGNANDRYNLTSTTQQNSWYAPNQAIGLATSQNTAGNNTLNSVGNVHNNASFIKTTTNSTTKRGLL